MRILAAVCASRVCNRSGTIMCMCAWHYGVYEWNGPRHLHISHARARQLDYGRAFARSLEAQSGNGPAQSCSLWIRKQVVNLRSLASGRYAIWLTENYVYIRQCVSASCIEVYGVCVAHFQNQPHAGRCPNWLAIQIYSSSVLARFKAY